MTPAERDVDVTIETQSCGCTCGDHVRWTDGRMRRLFWTMFIVGAGLGSIATSLGFGFMLG
jgi:hypothetical protein